jgi:hypothetical protein
MLPVIQSELADMLLDHACMLVGAHDRSQDLIEVKYID